LQANEQASCANQFNPEKETQLPVGGVVEHRISLDLVAETNNIPPGNRTPVTQQVANHFNELAPAGCSENALSIHSSKHNEVVML
jgi:hypothetical protein